MPEKKKAAEILTGIDSGHRAEMIKEIREQYAKLDAEGRAIADGWFDMARLAFAKSEKEAVMLSLDLLLRDWSYLPAVLRILDAREKAAKAKREKPASG